MTSDGGRKEPADAAGCAEQPSFELLRQIARAHGVLATDEDLRLAREFLDPILSKLADLNLQTVTTTGHPRA